MIYSCFNDKKVSRDGWDGWGKIWSLKVAPWVKHFLWLLFHNTVKTNEYLYRLNLGQQTLCTFCNLFTETVEHLFLNCHKSQEIWSLSSSTARKNINMSDGVSSGFWLSQELSGNDIYTQSVIAATLWFIWKARCNEIFRTEDLDCQLVANRAVRHTREYFLTFSPLGRKNFIMANFFDSDSPIILTASVVSVDLSIAGLGFIVSDHTSKLLYAGCCECPVTSAEDAAAKALCFAL